MAPSRAIAKSGKYSRAEEFLRRRRAILCAKVALPRALISWPLTWLPRQEVISMTGPGTSTAKLMSHSGEKKKSLNKSRNN